MQEDFYQLEVAFSHQYQVIKDDSRIQKRLWPKKHVFTVRLKAPNSRHFKTTGTLNHANRKRLAVVSVTPVCVLTSKQFLQSGAQLQFDAAGAQQMKHTPWLHTSWLYTLHVPIIMYVWTLIECFMGEHVLWGYTSVHTLIISLVYLVCPTSARLLGLSCTYLRYSTWSHLLLSRYLLLFCVCEPFTFQASTSSDSSRRFCTASSSWLFSDIISVLLRSSSASIAFFLRGGSRKNDTFLRIHPRFRASPFLFSSKSCVLCVCVCAHLSMASSLSHSACWRRALSPAPFPDVNFLKNEQERQVRFNHSSCYHLPLTLPIWDSGLIPHTHTSWLSLMNSKYQTDHRYSHL